MLPRIPLRSTLLAGALALALGACDDGAVTAPEATQDSLPEALTRTTSLDQLRGQAGDRPLRLEIDVRTGGPPWVAREVEVENDDDDEEKIESRIVALDAGAGVLVIALGELAVDLSAATRFRVEGAGDVSRESFFARVEAAIAGGRTPGVELRRQLPSSAQAPDDPTFLPRDVRLDNDADFGKVEVLVDDRHVAVDSDSRGRITVFGIEIVVDRSLGSQVGGRTESGDRAVEIEGVVDAVDVGAGRVSLVGGTELWIVEGTRFDADDDDELSSLQQVHDALAAGHWVEVEAEAVRGADGTWIAVEVEFEVEDDIDDDGLPGSYEFEGQVVAADPGARSFTLAGGTTLILDDRTRVDDDGDVFTLEQVAGALTAGLFVKAEGHVLPDPAAAGGSRLVDVKFETDDDDDGDDDGSDGSDDGTGTEFEGNLGAVDAGAGTFTLTNGVTYQVTGTTTYEADGDLFSLSAAAAALASGKVVEMEGDAVRDAATVGGWRVLSLKIEVDD